MFSSQTVIMQTLKLPHANAFKFGDQRKYVSGTLESQKKKVSTIHFIGFQDPFGVMIIR